VLEVGLVGVGLGGAGLVAVPVAAGLAVRVGRTGMVAVPVSTGVGVEGGAGVPGRLQAHRARRRQKKIGIFIREL
jgi:hypothetical protein